MDENTILMLMSVPIILLLWAAAILVVWLVCKVVYDSM